MNQIDHNLKKKNEKYAELMKDKLGQKILTKFVLLRPKTYTYLTGDNDEGKKKSKRHKKVLEKRKQTMFRNKLTRKKINLLWRVSEKIVKNSQKQ